MKVITAFEPFGVLKYVTALKLESYPFTVHGNIYALNSCKKRHCVYFFLLVHASLSLTACRGFRPFTGNGFICLHVYFT